MSVAGAPKLLSAVVDIELGLGCAPFKMSLAARPAFGGAKNANSITAPESTALDLKCNATLRRAFVWRRVNLYPWSVQG